MEHAVLYDFIIQNKDLVNNINNYYKIGNVPSFKFRIPYKFMIVLVSLIVICIGYTSYTKNKVSIKDENQNISKESCANTCKLPKKNVVTDTLDETDDDLLSDIEY